jgi:hypothetical protein
MDRMVVSDFADARPEWLLGLSQAYRRLYELIEADASRLEPGCALDLLEESGLAIEFADLMQLSIDLGLNLEDIAAFILAQVLSGQLDEYFGEESRSALEAFQQRVSDFVRALEHGGNSLPPDQRRMEIQDLRDRIELRVLSSARSVAQHRPD